MTMRCPHLAPHRPHRLGYTRSPCALGWLPLIAGFGCTLGEPYVIDEGPDGPGPSGPTSISTLASFESGTQGFGAPPGMANTSNVASTVAFHSDGQRGLSVTVNTAQWLGVSFASSRDFSTRTYIMADVFARSSASRGNLALGSGSNGWCELGYAAGGSMPLQATTTVSARLSTLNCSAANLGAVTGVYLWFDAGTFYVDNFRVQ